MLCTATGEPPTGAGSETATGGVKETAAAAAASTAANKSELNDLRAEVLVLREKLM
jgi:hypothetical protein